MKDIVEDYLSGEMIDPCEYSQFELEKLQEFLGDPEDEYDEFMGEGLVDEDGQIEDDGSLDDDIDF